MSEGRTKTSRASTKTSREGNPSYVISDLAGLLLHFLEREQISAPAIEARLRLIRPQGRMPMALWWQLLEELNAICRLQALGVRIGSHVEPRFTGALGYLILHCETLGEALGQFQRYQSLLHNFSTVQLDSGFHQGMPTLTLRWDVAQGRSTQLSDEVFLSSLATFVRRITRQPDLNPVGIAFNHDPPQDPGLYEALLGCPVRFGEQQVAIEFPAHILGLAVNGEDQWLQDMQQRQAACISQGNDLASRLQQLMASQLANRVPTLPDMARQLHLSSRTLHRKLEAEGQHFAGLLKETRKQLALMYLEDPSLSLQEVGFLLGYGEQSAFTRAFRGWFGQTPRRFRLALEESGKQRGPNPG